MPSMHSGSPRHVSENGPSERDPDAAARDSASSSTTANGGRALLVQHERATPGGYVRQWLVEHGWQVAELRIDHAVADPAWVSPDLASYDVVVSLGSEFAAYDDSVPFVRAELDLVRRAIEENVAVLGICFGGQLLARALGARVWRSNRAEVGWYDVELLVPGAFARGPWFQWHFDTFAVPTGAKLLAQSDVGPQAFRVGPHLGVQFHPEVTESIMEEWVDVYPHELREVGVDPEVLMAQTRAVVTSSQAHAAELLEDYLTDIGRADGEVVGAASRVELEGGSRRGSSG